MRLTPFQRMVAKNWLDLQSREPSYRRGLKKLVPAWIFFLAAGFAGWYVIRRWLGGGGLEWIVMGLVIGAMAVQFGALRHFIEGWELQKRVLDVDAIRQLLADDDVARAAGEGAPRPKRTLGWRAAAVLVVAALGLLLSVHWGMTAYHDPTRNAAARQVDLYTTAWCGYCRAVRAHLESRGVEYVDHDVEKSMSAHFAWSATQSRGVPVSVIGGKVVRGANLAKIDEALREAGFNIAQVPPAPASGEAGMSPTR